MKHQHEVDDLKKYLKKSSGQVVLPTLSKLRLENKSE